jgi:hypothetical protein
VSFELNRRRLATLRAALGFLQFPPRAPEVQILHRWLDTWTGVGLVVVGVERQGVPRQNLIRQPSPAEYRCHSSALAPRLKPGVY